MFSHTHSDLQLLDRPLHIQMINTTLQFYTHVCAYFNTYTVDVLLVFIA